MKEDLKTFSFRAGVFFFIGIVCFSLNFLVLAKEGSLAEDYYKLGKSLLERGEYEKANAAFKKAEEILNQKPFYNEDKIIKGYNKKDLTPKKLTSKKEEENKEKNSLIEQAWRLTLEGDKDNYKKAINLYKEIIEKNKRNYDAHYNLGVIYLKQKKYQEAAEEFKKVISLHPRDADAYYNLGIIYENYLLMPEEAIKYYRKFLSYSRQNILKNKVRSWIKYLKKQGIK